jgi:WD40 repeat protein
VPDPARGANPYKGPYAFTLKDAALFTGRDEEAETLLSLAISERIVVFCAPSGAGKSSLLNARLIPGLRRRGFKVLPVVRVGGDLPSGVEPANVFTFNALWILAGSEADPAALKDCTLDAFLKPIPRGRGRKGPPRVLIFDQFEEVLTTHPDRWPQRKDFFLQLRQALLDDPTLSVVMSLREDHLAGLDTYAPLLPGQLRTRFRMETLRRDKAVAAARQPALAAGLPFDPEVAERLVEDLSRVRMAGHEDPVPGEFVEPVQLQVVCYQLWENLRDQPRQTITEEDRRRFGDPDQALEGFYESALHRAAEKTGVPEAQIRHWCGTALITPTRIRSQVNREPEASGGLPNRAIESLVDSHLVRAEAARGGIWYELAHDRFVDPILRSNQRAAPSSATRLSEDARAWLKAGRDPSFLYGGLRLEEAVRSSKESSVQLSPQESEFLAHSQKAEADAQVRRARRLVVAVFVLGVLVLAALISAWVAWDQRRLSVARELALSATTVAKDDPDLGLLLALEAVDKARILETEAALHEAMEASAVRRVHSLPVSPNSPGAFAISPDGSQFAAVDLYGVVRIWDVKSGKLVSSGPRPTMFFITSLAWSRSGLVACGDEGGNVVFWKPGSGSPPPPPLAIGPGVISLAWSPDGSRLAIAGESPEVKIWNAATNTLEILPGEPGPAVLTVAFSRDGRYLAIVPERESERAEGLLVVRDLQTGERHTLHHPRPVTSVAFGPEGLLATGSQDTGLRIWDWRSGKPPQPLFGHRNRISDVAFSPDGKRLATASFDGEARIWSLGSGESLYTLSPEGGALSRVAFGPRGRILVTVSEAVSQAEQPTGALTLWNVTLDDHWTFPEPVRHLAGFTPDSRSLVAVTRAGQALRWDFSSQDRTPLLDGDSQIARAWLTAQAPLLAIRGQELLRQPVSPPGPVSREPLPSRLTTGFPDPTFSQDGHFLAFASYQTVSLLGPGATPGTSRIEVLPEQEEPVTAMGLSANGDLLAFATSDGSIHLWSVAEKDDDILRSRGNWVYDLEITPDGRWLASAESDRTIKLWDLETHTQGQTFEGHAGRVIGIAFSPDGRRLASSDEEGEVRLWEVAEGRNVFNVQGSSGAVMDLFFSPDGKWLATLSASGVARLKPLALDDLIARARRLSDRELTDRERRIYLHQD